MFGLLFRLFGLAIISTLVVFAAANAFRSKRRLDQRVREFKAEQARRRNTPGAINPYAAMAELYEGEGADSSKIQDNPEAGPHSPAY